MTSKPVSVRLTEKQKDTLRRFFGSTSGGAAAVADAMEDLNGLMEIFSDGAEALSWNIRSMPGLIHRAWAEMGGIFTEKQLHLLLEVMEPLKEAPTGFLCVFYVTEALAAIPSVEDSERKRVLKMTHLHLLQLTSFQRVSLECWAKMFWKGLKRRTDARDRRFLAMMGVA